MVRAKNERGVRGIGLIAIVAIAACGAGCSEDEIVPRSDASTSPAGDDAGLGDAAADTATADTATTDTATADTGADADGGPTDAGTEADCLADPGVDPYFTIEDATKCVVARYEVDGELGPLSWGRHGGPLGFEGGATPNLVRYQVPASATGTITVAKTAVPVTGVPSGAFWGAAATDLPFFDWTVFAYSSSGAGYPGEVFFVTPAGAITRYHVNGFFSAAGVGAPGAGRLLHTSLSPVSAAATSTNEGALYAADSCGSGATARLLPDGDGSCGAPLEVGKWEAGSSGPVTADPDGNAFATRTTFGGDETVRGFERTAIARGGAATAGTTIVSSALGVSDLVADGKGIFYQERDYSKWPDDALDVVTVGYTVDGAAKTVTPKGAAAKLLKQKTEGTGFSLVVDTSRRLWVGVKSASSGDAGTTSVVFVIRDKTP